MLIDGQIIQLHFGVKQLRMGKTTGVLHSLVRNNVKDANIEGFHRISRIHDGHSLSSIALWKHIYLQKELNDAIELLDKIERREPLLGVTDQQLWKAQKIKQVNKEFGLHFTIMHCNFLSQKENDLSF